MSWGASVSSPLGATITAAEIEDGVITNAKIASNAAIAFSKLAACQSGRVLLGNASNVVTATELSGDVVVSDTGVVSTKMTYLGGGTYTNTTYGVFEDAGNFSTPGDLGNGIIVISIVSERTSGSGTSNIVGIDMAAGNQAAYYTAAAQNPCLLMWIRRSASTATESQYHCLSNATLNYGTFNFVNNDAETYYIKLKNGTSGNTIVCRWVAWLWRGA